MNLKVVLNYIGHILRIEGISMIPALVIALYKDEVLAMWSFLLTIIVLVIFGSFLTSIKTEDRSIFSRDGFIIVSLSWIFLSLFGALPFFFSGAIPSYLDCFFETVSGFTTTGASILAEVESLPMSLLYWRSFTHWLGGMGVLVFVLAILPSSTSVGGSIKILRAESPGPVVGKLVPKMRHTARILYIIYIVMTLIEIIMLYCGGMPIFDSVTTSFGTAGTGGFAVRNAGIAAYGSAYIDIVISVFMLLFGVNFNIYYMLLMRDFRGAFKNQEMRLYFGIVGASVVAIAINTLSIFGFDVGKALRYSFFQVSSIITTTGFATYDFDKWPEFSRCLLVMLMIIGACAGSTGGGIKVYRFLILLKSLRNSIVKMVHPKSVRLIKVDGKTIDNTVLAEVNAFCMTYILITTFSILIVSFDNYSFDTTISGVLACINNIGPGLGIVGPMGNFSSFSALSKIVLSADMLFGRLEIFPLLLIFTPILWKRTK